MSYDERSLKEIAEKYQDTGRIHEQLMVRLGSLHSKLTNDKANEYLMQGAGRRLKILRRCLVNIFRIFPIGQAEHLAPDELADLEINLHAFVVNVSVLFDNLGWVFACEHDLLGKQKDGKLGKMTSASLTQQHKISCRSRFASIYSQTVCTLGIPNTQRTTVMLSLIGYPSTFRRRC